MGNRFIREVRTVCGQNYMEVDLFPISEREKASTRRAKRSQVSSLVQQNLNGKHAKRYFVQLVNTNFNEHDLHVTLTYDDEHLPATLQQAEKDRDDFLRRLQYWGRKSGIKVKMCIRDRDGTTQECTGDSAAIPYAKTRANAQTGPKGKKAGPKDTLEMAMKRLAKVNEERKKSGLSVLTYGKAVQQGLI